MHGRLAKHYRKIEIEMKTQRQSASNIETHLVNIRYVIAKLKYWTVNKYNSNKLLAGCFVRMVGAPWTIF